MSVLELLHSAFPGNVITPDSAQYEAAKSTPWSQTCWSPAAAYVQLKNAQEVAEAIRIVKKTGVKFAIRGAGHNPNAGFSSTDGIVLDIRQLQSKAMSGGLAQLGAGNLWGETYQWLEEQNLSAVGGRDRQVGIAGFLLGGGLGAFPNLHGTGADGVTGFEVVLADGSIVNANAKENPDLHRALKGGGSNFGIVTRFDLETRPLVKAEYEINLYSPDDYENIINATIKVQESMEKDPKIGLFTNFNAGFVAVGLLYADWPEERPAFSPFLELKSLMMNAAPKSRGTLLSLAETMGHAQEAKKRMVCTATTKVSRELYIDVHKAWIELAKLPEGMVLHYTIQPVGESGVQAGRDRGGNSMGLEKVPQCWWVFTCEWPQDGDDEAAEKAIKSMTEAVQSLAREKGLLLDFLLPTFATASQNVLASYGTDNVKQLQATAAKYDPDGVFQKLQTNGFLLRNV